MIQVFIEKYKRIKELKELINTEKATRQKIYEDELYKLYKEKVQGRKKKQENISAKEMIRALGDEESADIYNVHYKSGMQAITNIQAEIDDLYAELDELAETTECPKSNEPVKIITRSETSYPHQINRMHYARIEAAIDAMGYNKSNIQTEIRSVKIEDKHCYEVWGYTTEEGAILAKFKPGLSLRDSIKFCIQSNLSPRVMFHGLPANYHKIFDIDELGNDGYKPNPLEIITQLLHEQIEKEETQKIASK